MSSGSSSSEQSNRQQQQPDASIRWPPATPPHWSGSTASPSSWNDLLADSCARLMFRTGVAHDSKPRPGNKPRGRGCREGGLRRADMRLSEWHTGGCLDTQPVGSRPPPSASCPPTWEHLRHGPGILPAAHALTLARALAVPPLGLGRAQRAAAHQRLAGSAPGRGAASGGHAQAVGDGLLAVGAHAQVGALVRGCRPAKLRLGHRLGEPGV